MALNENEKLLVEGIKTMLSQESELGLSIHDEDSEEDKHDWRGSQYLHEQINEMFELKASELLHAESVFQAFRKIHNYKYIEDNTFNKAMMQEMTATAVPLTERNKALSFVKSIIEELKTESENWTEQDSGFSPFLDEIKETSKPEQPIDFNIEKRRLNNRNVEKPKRGDGSPVRSGGKPPLPKDGYDAESNEN